jgi:hypothetical protein
MKFKFKKRVSEPAKEKCFFSEALMKDAVEWTGIVCRDLSNVEGPEWFKVVHMSRVVQSDSK